MIYTEDFGIQYVYSLCKEHNVEITAWSRSSCGYAVFNSRKIKIPQPTNIDRFAVCLHEIKHIIDQNGDGINDLKYRFVQEFECDMFALNILKELELDTKKWEKRIKWHSLSRIAMATNRGYPVSKIPERILTYFDKINFQKWEGKKVFVSCDGWYNKFKISISAGKRKKSNKKKVKRT